MTLNDKKYIVQQKEKLHDVKCPNPVCGNNFLVVESTYHREFVCKKCGSEWYGGLPMDNTDEVECS